MLGQIERNTLVCHTFADDTQLLLKLDNRDHCLETLDCCLTTIQRWMNLNHLKLNGGKTEFLLFDPSSKHPHKVTGTTLLLLVSVGTPALPLTLKQKAEILSIVFDARISFDEQLAAVILTANFGLATLRKVLPFVPQELRGQVVGALINSRLYYGNGQRKNL